MNEIKFRAWNKEKNIMVYDNEDNSSGYWDGCYNSDVGMVNSILNSKYNEKYEFMEFTGLKDKNGVEIYEGDIVATEKYNGELVKGVMKFGKFNCSCCSGVYGWYIDTEDYYYLDIRDFDTDIMTNSNIEVIGNIYENKELLEGK